MRFGRWIAWGVVSVLVLAGGMAAAAAYMAFFTPEGSRLAAEWAIKKWAEPKSSNIRRVRGTLAGEVRLRNVELESPRGLPPGSVVRVQELRADLDPLSPMDSQVSLSNGRAFLPGSQDPIVVFVRWKEQKLDGSVYARAFGVADLNELGGETWSMPYGFSGTVRDLDCDVRGTPGSFRVWGRVAADSLTYYRVSLKDAPVRVNLRVKKSKRHRGVELRGQLVFLGGTVVSRKTSVRLQQSRLRFYGDFKRPLLTLHGTSEVEGTKIRISVRGTPSKPELRLTSDPPLPETRLLLMLATGKGWKSGETLAGGKEIPLDLARDFMGVFFLSESEEALLQKLGLADISVTYDTETGGVGVKKPVTSRTQIKYGVSPVRTDGGAGAAAGTAHSIGAELKVTDRFSLEAEQEMRPQSQLPETPEEEDAPQGNSKVLLKYKRRF